MHLEPEARGELSAVTDELPFGLRLVDATFGERVAPRAGMDFDDRCTQFGGHLDLCRSRADEQRNTDSRVLELAHDGRKLRALAHRIETALGRSLRAFFRNEAGCMRPRLERDVDHF